MNDLYLQQMKELLTDEEYEEYLKLLDQPHQRGIRVNTLKTDAAELFELTGPAGEKSPFAENGYFLASGAAAGKTPAYRAGLFYIQEPSASAAVTVLDPQPCMKSVVVFGTIMTSDVNSPSESSTALSFPVISKPTLNSALASKTC